MGHWEEAAQNYEFWEQHWNKCLNFLLPIEWNVCIKFSAARRTGLTDCLLILILMFIPMLMFICSRHHWNLAQYFATLPVHRWIKRVMAWHPEGHRRNGHPKYRWGSMIENFCRLKDIPSWEMAAVDDDLWRSLLPDL